MERGNEYYRPLPEGLIIRRSEYLSKITGNEEESGMFATKEFPSGLRLGITHVKTDRPEFPSGLIRTPLGGFFNHNSKDPNCQVVHEGDFIYVETIKDINPGDELTAEYTLYNPEK